MKTITNYEAFDGKVFATEIACAEYENKIHDRFIVKTNWHNEPRLESRVLMADEFGFAWFDEFDAYVFAPHSEEEFNYMIEQGIALEFFIETKTRMNFIEDDEKYLPDYVEGHSYVVLRGNDINYDIIDGSILKAKAEHEFKNILEAL